ncbi:putative Fe-S protein [Ignavibacterium album JCM 16511]|uniref:Putative Fe-S protein n=1 Tax=Ignavibacterium album (strain DSM 19864 / JCM 16511 / NBRC 101810 / Mat9-16) TaxID=945713 RepID=I0AFT5_IGNAJ|nr:radical SAM protein [Ignavibacterium album]AFH47842.1 putative Fe-S protein [Ignavibacterium album JCM 16511]
MSFIPSYKKISEKEFDRRIRVADSIIKNCTSCPRNCLVDRTKGELGTCQSGDKPIVSSYTLHFGEEPVLSGTNGAGNIFFGNCNLRCVYCQNFVISQNPKTEKRNEVTVERLAEIMIELQNMGSHNIRLVSPTHFTVPILKSIRIASQLGLNLPIIYNTNGYDSVEMLKLYKDVIDIYLPDFKYGNNDYGRVYSKVTDYFDKAKLAIKEMYNQVGSELVYENGVVVRGLIIRHLILPNDLSETEKVFKFISEELDKKIHISLMTQYYPTNRSEKHILINRSIRYIEFANAVELLDKYGLENGWLQELESNEFYRPSFEVSRDDPFNNKKLKLV